jgi:hypothetical protein
MAIDAEKLRTVGVYEAQAPLGSVMTDAAAIDQAAQRFAAVRKHKLGQGFLALGAAVLCIVLAASVGLVLLGVLLFMAGVALAVVLWVSAYRYGRNLKTYQWRFELLKRLGASLAQDSDLNSAVTVSLGLKDRSRLLREEVWPLRKRGRQRFLEDDWLSVQGRFLDGTEYTENVRELIRRRTYVNPRGKSKVKYRSQHFIGLRLACPRELYGDLRPLAEGLKKSLRLPASASIRGLKVGGKVVFLRVRVDQVADLPLANVMMYLGLYRALNLARQLQGRQK